MKEKKKSLRLEQFLCIPLITFLILLFCGIPRANAQTPQQIAKKALSATVPLVMEDANGELLGYGSGFFVRSNQIATNFHVIDGTAQGTVKRVGQETEYTIEGITAMDESHDLAILQVSASGVQPLPLGDSDTVEIGDTVYVAGNPKGFFEGTFSDGIITGIRGDSTNKRLQMTAPVSSGSSGGPVLNSIGEVIGVSFATFRGGQNLNFAIPSNYLKELLTQLGTAKPLSKGKQSTPAETYFLRGWVKDELGDYKGAIADYDIAIQLNPNDADTYLNRGVAKNKLGQYFAAITDFDTAIRIKPDYADAYYNRGVAKDNLDQHNAATADYETAIRIKPDLAQDYLNRGNAKYKFGLYRSAIDNYDAAIRLKPNYAEAYYNRGNAKVDSGQHNAAINDYDTAIQLKPGLAEVYLNRGIAKDKLGQYNAAINDYDTAIRLKSDYTEAYLNRGIAKADSGQYTFAINDYEIAIILNPDYAEAYYNRGVAKDKLGQHAAAINNYDTAIRLNPDYAKAYNGRGMAKDKLKQHFAAITDFDTAIRINPDYADAYYNRGNVKGKLGQYTAAIDDYDIAIQFNPAIRINPDYATTYLNRGIAKADSGQYIAAINDYDIAIQIKPNYTEAFYNRGVAKDKLGQYTAAFNDFDTAIQLKPNIASQLKRSYAKAYLKRGNAKADSGQYTAAIADYDIAIQIKPDYADAFYKRKVAKDKLKDKLDEYTFLPDAASVGDTSSSQSNRRITQGKGGSSNSELVRGNKVAETRISLSLENQTRLSEVSHLTQPYVALVKIGHHLLKTRKSDTLDIVFVIDASKSMRNDIDALRNHLNQMTDLLEAAELDFTVGLVVFRDSAMGWDFQVTPQTTSIQEIKHKLNSIHCRGGEKALDALVQAAAEVKFRRGAERRFILITDEYVRGSYSPRKVLNKLKSEKISVTIIGRAEPFQKLLVQGTGGLWTPISSLKK